MSLLRRFAMVGAAVVAALLFFNAATGPDEASAQTPPAPPKATATATPAAPKAPAPAQATPAKAPTPAKTGNAGLGSSSAASPVVIGLTGLLAATLVLGARRTSQRRR